MIRCAIGVTEQGQGTETMIAQIAATAVGVDISQVRVITGDTAATPYGGGAGPRAAPVSAAKRPGRPVKPCVKIFSKLPRYYYKATPADSISVADILSMKTVVSAWR